MLQKAKSPQGTIPAGQRDIWKARNAEPGSVSLSVAATERNFPLEVEKGINIKVSVSFNFYFLGNESSMSFSCQPTPFFFCGM